MSLQLDNLARNMTDELDKAVAAKPVTGFFADNPLRSKFVGAKTVLIPEMEVSGLGDYDRDNGFVKGTIAVSAQPHVLAMDTGTLLPARIGRTTTRPASPTWPVR